MWLDADSEIYSEVTKGEAYLRKPLFLKRTCLLREASGVEMWSQDCQDHQLGLKNGCIEYHSYSSSTEDDGCYTPSRSEQDRV